MHIERAEFAVYNARAFDLLKRWQEHRVPRRDVDAIAGPQPDSTTALLGYEAEAIPLGLKDPRFIVEGGVDECREHRSISGIHVFSFGPGLRIWDQPLLRPWCQCHHKTPTPTTATAIGTRDAIAFKLGSADEDSDLQHQRREQAAR
jgi:hypothetical protein